MKNNVLWVSLRAPYDTVAHASGKIHNFYLKKLQNSKKFNIKLITFFNDDEAEKLDFEKYGIDTIAINATRVENDISFLIKVINVAYHVCGRNKYLDLITRKLNMMAIEKIKQLKVENNYYPDVIILQWTQIITLLPTMKKIFPKTKIVVIEEDVTFLAVTRRIELSSSNVKKIYHKLEEISVKRIERKCLSNANLVILNNNKDLDLIIENGIQCTSWVWSPYFQNMLNAKRNRCNKDIVYYGAMSRPENWKSTIWFIENVLGHIKDEDVRLLIIGNKPNEELLKYDDGKKILVVGFVENIEPYFSTSLCLVAPLVLGAGIKIKVLEALSSGIPVLTNEIGIEGIPAQDKKEFLFCSQPEEYVRAIKFLIDNQKEADKIEICAKKFINENYNCEADAIELADRILSLLTEDNN
ncbi:MAG: glycosyltransferase [Desulfosporosinus sp.]|nr:glycosyltransferase [Desulfosporosinus sp.]